MSHFTVLVVTEQKPDDGTLESALLPFHEYECTGIEAYLEFVPYEDFERDYAEHGEGRGQAEFAHEWYGDHVECRNGAWGRMTNPNRKWDWWSVGGRWSRMLLSRTSGNVDQCRKDDLDLERMAADRAASRVKQWAGYEKERPAPDVEDFDRRDDRARWLCGIPERVDRDTFLMTDKGFTTFAVLYKGEWYEKGRMGWFALVSDEKTDWPQQFRAIFDDIPSDYWLTIVDCHI